jgi:NAD(P)-dependent dehydrogenase (short-subunit alcohol dehydrogenase family)
VLGTKADQKKHGRFLGGTAPFGWQVGRDGALIEVTRAASHHPADFGTPPRGPVAPGYCRQNWRDGLACDGPEHCVERGHLPYRRGCALKAFDDWACGSVWAAIDVTREADWTALIAKTLAAFGRLDILVNNAGISGSSVGSPDGLDGWHRIIAVNQTSVFLGTKLAAEQMARSGGGSIVNISSIMGFVGSTSGHPAYHASKGAVRIYSKAAAVRYGPSGVRVNTVHPGYMPPMLNATNAEERADKIALTPLRRIGEPIEVAFGVLFLASDEASFVTGAELVIDGGFIAQ